MTEENKDLLEGLDKDEIRKIYVQTARFLNKGYIKKIEDKKTDYEKNLSDIIQRIAFEKIQLESQRAELVDCNARYTESNTKLQRDLNTYKHIDKFLTDVLKANPKEKEKIIEKITPVESKTEEVKIKEEIIEKKEDKKMINIKAESEYNRATGKSTRTKAGKFTIKYQKWLEDYGKNSTNQIT